MSAQSGGLLWADLSLETLRELDSAADPRQKITILTETMKIRHYEDNPRSTILVDFCLYNLIFCDEHGFTLPKKSAFFSIMKSVFEHSFSNERVSMEESLNFFKKNVMTHCVEAPKDGRVGVFSLADVKSMTKFIGETFYRNYTAYQVVFSTIQPVERVTRHLMVETPLTPKPLDLADEV